MTSDIRALSHSEHELFEITSPSSGAARKHYRDDNTHSILSSTPPSVTAQAGEMVAEFAISNSNYDMYPPGHALYEWAQQQLGRPNRLDEPQMKRRAMADPRSKSSQPTKGGVPSSPLQQRPPILQSTPSVHTARPPAAPTKTAAGTMSTKAVTPQQQSVQANAVRAPSTDAAKPRPGPTLVGRGTAAQEQKQLAPPQRSPAPVVVGAARPTPPPRREGAPRETQDELMLVLREDEEKKSSTATTAVMTRSTVLRDSEIADLRRFHDNSLAFNSRKAYLSDYHSFVHFMEKRFPDIAETQLQAKCTLEHVLAYLSQQCNDGKKIATVNRRLSTIKKHILPSLFHKASVPGSREEQIGREMDAIVRGMRRTVGAEHRVRGKRPLLIENIIDMCEVAALTRSDGGDAMPNTRCRDVCLLLFMFFSAMRRSEIQQLLWSDLTFDTRGVVVQIGHSKTDKESKGQAIAISRLDDGERAAFCPVKALEAWREVSRGAGDSPVFRWISKRDEIQWRVLIDQRIVALVKLYADAIGLDSRLFAAHSTRSGYVTSSTDRGVPVSEVMKRTRHKSLSSVSVYMKSDELFSSSGDRKL